MRLWLARIFLVGRRHGNAPSTRRQSAACPNPSEANRRLSSSFYAAWTTTAAQQKLAWPSAISLQQLRQFGSLTILPPVCKPLLVSIRGLHPKGRGPRKWKLSVKLTEEKWRILVESGASARYEKMYRVEISDRLMSTDDKHLVVIGYKKAATEVVALLQRPLNEADEQPSAESRRSKKWLAPTHLIREPLDGKSVVVSAETWQLFKEYDVLDTLESVYNVHIRATELPSKQMQLTLHGWNAEKVKRMLADPPLQMNVPRVVGCWLTSEGPQGTRVKVIRRTLGALVKPSQDIESVLLVGPSNATFMAKSFIGDIVVEKVTVTQLQPEFLFGHDGDDEQQRPHHKLEYETDTSVELEQDADCVNVAGRPDNAKEAVERKSQHIKLKTQRVSMAVGNYVAAIRRDLENDDRQIHLRPDRSTYSSSCELRRLHRVDSEQDDAKAEKADQELMQEIDLHEVVLNVHASFARLLRERCGPIEADERVGLDISTAVNGRVLVSIAGSRTTVKGGTNAVIELLSSDARYREGDIRLRRIEGQSVDTAGFEKAAPVRKEDLSDCEEPFVWQRLTSEQWLYTGRSSPERKRKRSVKSKQHKVSENAKANSV
ncbi:hypothetical protein AAVH_32793 [Aphelenchoides avenae]|nr:hypothetical protein AAVH_32793 [Aphelenchus avenae]